MKDSGLHGTWNLKAIYSESRSGERKFHFGKDAIGRLIYTPDGYMNAFIMQKDRPVFAEGKIDQGTPEEIRSAFQSFDAYTGKYTINVSEGTVVHHVDMARSPTWIDLDLVRHFNLSNHALSIYTDEFYSDAQGENIIVYVEWEKL